MNSLNLEVSQTAPHMEEIVSPGNLWITLFNYWAMVRRSLKSGGQEESTLHLHVSWHSGAETEQVMNSIWLDDDDDSGDWRSKGVLICDSFKTSQPGRVWQWGDAIRNETRSIVVFSMEDWSPLGATQIPRKRRKVILHFLENTPFEKEPFALTIQYRSKTQRETGNPYRKKDPFEISVYDQWDLVGTILGHRTSVSIQRVFHPFLDWNRGDMTWGPGKLPNQKTLNDRYLSLIKVSLKKAKIVSIALLKALEETSVLGLEKMVIRSGLEKFSDRFSTLGCPFSKFTFHGHPILWESITPEMLFPMQEHLEP
jgi:hypothetical protein